MRAVLAQEAPGISMQPIISIKGLQKTYASGHRALKGVDLDIRRGEIFALLGPNGAGKTTMIGATVSYTHLTLPTKRIV